MVKVGPIRSNSVRTSRSRPQFGRTRRTFGRPQPKFADPRPMCSIPPRVSTELPVGLLSNMGYRHSKTARRPLSHNSPLLVPISARPTLAAQLRPAWCGTDPSPCAPGRSEIRRRGPPRSCAFGRESVPPGPIIAGRPMLRVSSMRADPTARKNAEICPRSAHFGAQFRTTVALDFGPRSWATAPHRPGTSIPGSAPATIPNQILAEPTPRVSWMCCSGLLENTRANPSWW